VTESTLSIGVLLPDVLGTYSDTGNATVLAQRARWRGVAANIVHLPAASTPAATCDIYLLGGGEDAAQQFAVSWLQRHPALLHAMETRAVTLAVCAGMQILGRTMVDDRGDSHPGVGLLDLTTTAGRHRAVGELVTQCRLPGVGLLTGFENHRGTTTLGPDVAPLGQVLAGVGNGPGPRRRAQRVDGAVTDRVIATYLHGPVLAHNPTLADHLLEQATGQTLTALDLPDQAQLRRARLQGVKRWRRRFLP
jgi:CobQ-like glutamine amidotransferase family enzyme